MNDRGNTTPAVINTRKCTAWDCPLNGTHSDSINGSSSWTCKYHHKTQSDKWQSLTLFIKNNLHLYLAYTKLVHMAVLDWETQRNRWQKASVPAKKDEDLYSYRGRVLKHFEEKIHA